MQLRFVRPFTATLREDDGQRLSTLLWGDPVHVLSTSGDQTKVLARGRPGWLETNDLTDEGLLEIYIIDVGQGDGVLVRTPAGKWILVDGGKPAADQMTKKGAANFLRWKFIRELRLDAISLESIIVSHPDHDHYGGIVDLLRGRLYTGTTFDIEVGTLYHSGLPRFSDPPALGTTVAGEVAPFPMGYRGIQRRGSFHTELLEDSRSFRSPPRPLSRAFGEYAALGAREAGGVRSLSHRTGYLPGYAPGDGDLSIRVLGPILEDVGDGTRGLRRLAGSDAITLNGHSVVLRLDLGEARILLTGDLNSKSQRLLRSYHPDSELAVDVAKACHHGSEDVDLEFLAAMQPRATVVSSGDNEDYAHPRPVVMGASARYGREGVDERGGIVPPLVYSTELARSVKLGFAKSVRVVENAQIAPPKDFQVLSAERTARYEPLERLPLSTDLIYGLVNVRTDGEWILCATMEERGNDFDVKVIRAGVSPRS